MYTYIDNYWGLQGLLSTGYYSTCKSLEPVLGLGRSALKGTKNEQIASESNILLVSYWQN